MKNALFNMVLLAGICCTSALNTIDEYASDIPSCAFKSFKKAMESEECKVDGVDTSTIDCLCRHLSAIAVAVSGEVDTTCSLDFAQAAGSLCGTYAGYGTTASGFAEATSILGKDLGGSGDDAPAATSASDLAAKSSAAAAATTTSNNAAALPTFGYGMAGVVGGAVILAGELL